MKKYKIEKNHIHLVRISEEITLFLHTETLQIYPINDKALLSFLSDFKKNGHKVLVDNLENQLLFDFINQKVAIAPPSSEIKKIKTTKEKYETIVLPISATCNLSCPYCFAQTENGFGFKNFQKEDIDNIVKFLVKKNIRKKNITIIFFGGEPLLSVSIIKYTINLFIEKYPQYKINYSITTNGTVLNDEIIQIFKENNFAVLISLDGFDNEYNVRKFKTGNSSVNSVIENIYKLKNNGIYPNLRATLLNNNPYICETYDFFEKLELPFNIVFAYTSENKSHSFSNYNEDVLNLINDQLNSLIDYYVKKLINKDIIYNSTLVELISIFRYRVKKQLACTAGMDYFTITSDKDIFSCAHLMNDVKYKIGNINETIINKKNLVSVFIEDISACQKCWVKHLCLGGCPAQKISMGTEPNLPMTQENCSLEKIRWEFYLKLYYYITQISPEYL